MGLPHGQRKDSWLPSPSPRLPMLMISSIMILLAIGGRARNSGFRHARIRSPGIRSGRGSPRSPRSGFLAPSGPRPAGVAPGGQRLLAAFGQSALAPVFAAGALFGLAAHPPTQAAERHRVRILAP